MLLIASLRPLSNNSPSIQKDYASEVCERLKSNGLFADVDNGADTLPKKVRNGEIAQYNFILGMSAVASFVEHDHSSHRAPQSSAKRR